MTGLALILVLLSALSHATWNLLVKRAIVALTGGLELIFLLLGAIGEV